MFPKPSTKIELGFRLHSIQRAWVAVKEVRDDNLETVESKAIGQKLLISPSRLVPFNTGKRSQHTW